MNKFQRRYREIIVSSTISKTAFKNYRSIDINLSKSLKKIDSNEYNTWTYVIWKKLKIDEFFYSNDKQKIKYVFNQMKNFILKKIFKKIENYMSIHHQKKNAKKKFQIVKMNKTKNVSKYYHRLFKLWQRADISFENQINVFIEFVFFDISNAFQAREYKNFIKLLKNVKRIENYRKNVINNFYSNKKKSEKTNKFFTSNRGIQKITTQIVVSKTNVSSAKPPHFNEKFGTVNKKPENWIEFWYDDKQNLDKLTNEDRNTLIKQNRCWFCKKLKHKKHDLICMNAGQKNKMRINKMSAIIQKTNETKFDSSFESKKK